jgi:DNA-binding beta-propeller fold protein YncE
MPSDARRTFATVIAMRLLFTLLLAAMLAACATVSGDAAMGTKPSYLQTVSRGVPNEAALHHRIWTPELDNTFVPQGLTSAGNYLFVSSYKPTPDLKANTGPCRVFRIEKATGKAAGHFDIPAGTCTHSGGLAYVGMGKLMLADTYQLFLVDIDKALASGTSAGAQKAVKIAGGLRGSYATFDGSHAWIGTWTTDPSKAVMWRLDPSFFDRYDGQTVREDRALESIPVPLEAQGAAFDKDGKLWVSASNGRWGKLYLLDRKGNVQAEYPMVAGLEDLTVDDAGQLWGLSESGTMKYLSWETKFPFIFQIDVRALK